MKYWLSIALSLSVRGVGACDCQVWSMQRAYQSADCVVQARVEALRDTVHYDLYSQPVRPPFRSGYLPVLRLQKVLKGRLTSQQVILTDAGAGGWCDFYFQMGGDYVVFLNKDGKGGYMASPCQKHFPLTDTASVKALQLVNK